MYAIHMTQKRLDQINQRILKIKEELRQIGEMRPGSLSHQYKVPEKKAAPYWQLSYTHKMKSRTDYVRPSDVADLRRQIATYKRFKKLVTRWVDLAIEHSKLKSQLTKQAGIHSPRRKTSGANTPTVLIKLESD
jgi:hypothetical protein